MRKLPPHPNIVTMHGVFVDQTPDLPGGAEAYPSALPPRLNKEGGFGRNSTMFLVMKKWGIPVSYRAHKSAALTFFVPSSVEWVASPSPRNIGAKRGKVGTGLEKPDKNAHISTVNIA